MNLLRCLVFWLLFLTFKDLVQRGSGHIANKTWPLLYCKTLVTSLERPVYVTSGYRCPRYNQKIGGVVNSYHCIGLAVDIKVKDINLIELLEICENIDFSGIGFYEKKNFLHLDVRPTKRSRWRE